MVKFEGKYEREKSDNLVEYIISLGQPVPDEIAKNLRENKTVLIVEIKGDQQYTFSNKNGIRDNSLNFTIGKPFQEIIETQGLTLENIAKQEGNRITISSIMNGKKNERIYDFSESGVIVTLQSPESKIVAKDHYKRV